MSISCYIAHTQEAKLRALQLVYDSYVKAGLLSPSDLHLRVTPWHASGDATIFVAENDGEIIYTMSVIRDSHRGLPMESLYPKEIDTLRRLGRKIAEVGSLAGTGSNLDALLHLCRLVFCFGLYHNLDHYVICVNPRHARFYERFWGFRQIGPVKECPYVNNAPGVALELDFSKIDIRLPERTKKFVAQANFKPEDFSTDNDWDFLRQYVDSDMRPGMFIFD